MIRETAALCALAVATLPAGAQSLRERQTMQAAETAFAEATRSVAAVCGATFEGRIEWSKFSKQDLGSQNSISGWCEAPVDALRSLCTASDADLAKAAVKEKVRAIVCTRGTERSLALVDGVVEYGVTFDSANDADFARDWFLDNL